MFKRNNPDHRYNGYPEMQSFNNSQMYPNLEMNRLIYEIKENRRRLNNLAKRLTRIESYLRIKDTSDYIDDSHNPNDFTF